MFGFFRESIQEKPRAPSIFNHINLVPLYTTILWTTADALECWQQYDVPYWLNCIGNGREMLENHLINLTAALCGNITNITINNCRYYPNAEKFGSNFYHSTSICTLRYPFDTQADPCTISVLANNTPVGEFSTTEDIMITAGIVTGGLFVTGFFAASIAKKCINVSDNYQELIPLSGAEAAVP